MILAILIVGNGIMNVSVCWGLGCVGLKSVLE